LKLQQFITSVYNKISVVKVYISYLYIYENCEFEKLNEMVTNATRLRFHCRWDFRAIVRLASNVSRMTVALSRTVTRLQL